MKTGLTTPPVNNAKVSPATIGLYTWKVGEDLVYADSLVADLFGLDGDAAKIGLPLERFLQSIHGDDVNRVQAAISAAVETGDSYGIEYRVLSASGHERTIRAMGQCFRNTHGQPSEWAGTILVLDEREIPSCEDAVLVDACITAYQAAGRAGADFVTYLLSMVLIELGHAEVSNLEPANTVH
jgi:hypothetical protein